MRGQISLLFEFFGGLPAGFFEKFDGKADGNCHICRRAFRKNAEIYADHFARLTEERRARTAFRCFRIVDDAPRVEIGDRALRR